MAELETEPRMPMSLQIESTLIPTGPNVCFGGVGRLGIPIGSIDLQLVTAWSALNQVDSSNNPLPGRGTIGLGGALAFTQRLSPSGLIHGSLGAVGNFRPLTAEYLANAPMTAILQMDVISYVAGHRLETSVDGTLTPGGYSQGLALERVELYETGDWGFGLVIGVMGHQGPTTSVIATVPIGGVIRWGRLGDIVVTGATNGDIVVMERLTHPL